MANYFPRKIFIKKLVEIVSEGKFRYTYDQWPIVAKVSNYTIKLVFFEKKIMS